MNEGAKILALDLLLLMNTQHTVSVSGRELKKWERKCKYSNVVLTMGIIKCEIVLNLSLKFACFKGRVGETRATMAAITVQV